MGLSQYARSLTPVTKHLGCSDGGRKIVRDRKMGRLEKTAREREKKKKKKEIYGSKCSPYRMEHGAEQENSIMLCQRWAIITTVIRLS